MMGVAHPRERARDGDGDSQVGNHAHDEHRVVVVLVVDEDSYNLEQEPGEPRQRASGVDPTKVLEDRCAAQAEPQRCPLRKNTHKQSSQRGESEFLTLAKQKLMTRYKNRPNSSFRMRMAVSKLPRTNADVYCRG